VPALLEGAEASVGGPAGGRDSRAGSKKRPEADKRSGAVFDVKSFLPPGCADERL
jgi:hypothetical protein